jgi:Flp pilus assembly protein TadG
MLWLPLIFTIILFTVDVALIYLKQADMWNVARDISRRMAQSSTYANSGNAPSDARAKLFASLQSATITAVSCGAPPTLPNPASPCSATPSGSIPNFYEVVTIQIPLCTASLFGVVGCYSNTVQLTARATIASEY